jgi:hypothetical protein
VVVVERLEGVGPQHGAGDDDAVRPGRRRAVQAGGEIEEVAAHGLRCGAEPVPVVACGDPGGEVVEAALGGRAHGAVLLVPDPARVDGAVEHHPVDAGAEELPVDGAEVGAVRPAQVGDAAFAEGGADPVHVAGGVGRRDVP